MNYLSLFSGVEGGGLAFQYLIKPKINCIGYVEIDGYCQKVIRQRQKDKLLDKAPIFGNIQTFIDSGCAKLYKGITNLITAGFPCQPFSVAGKQAGEDDPRNMWPATCKTIEIIRPERVFLENVPGLLSSGYFKSILSDLAQMGYDARWCHLSASDCGAPHKRERLWILAYTKSISLYELGINQITKSIKQKIWCRKFRRYNYKEINWNGDEPEWAICESRISTMDDGVAHQVDRLKAIGNGQVPQVAAVAWKILNNKNMEFNI